MPVLSIVMPCHNRAYELHRVLKAYDCQDAQFPFELIAVDDASTDETFDVLRSFQPQNYTLTVLKQPENQGPAAARNRGFERATAPLLLIVGDDILPSRSMLRLHVDAHRVYPEENLAVLGKVQWPHDMPVNTLMEHIDGVGAQQFSYHYMKHGQSYDFRHFYTANISLKASLLHSMDRWFDTDFPYPAYEDVEFSFRLKQKAGLEIRYFSDIAGFHYHHHTIRSFTNRQYRAGLMSYHVMRKHPGSLGVFRNFRFWGWFYYLQALGMPARSSHQALEDRAIRLASLQEWSPRPGLDALYLAILDYFSFKGWLEARYQGAKFKARIHDRHALRVLKPVLTDI